MPAVVSVSSAMLPCPVESRGNGRGTRWFHGGRAPPPDEAQTLPNPAFSAICGQLCLDSAPRPAISPATRRGIFSRCLFLRDWRDRSPDSAEIEPITTEEKAG